MTRMLPLVAVLAGLAVPAAAQAQDKPFTLQDAVGTENFSISGSVRLRYETFDNDFRPAARDGAQMLTLRTRIVAEYRAGALSLGGELRDARAYLNDAGTPFGSGDVNALEPVQLYAALDLGRGIAGGRTQVKAGRFLVNLGSKRLAGDPGFRSAANAFTGVRLDWTGADKQALTLLYTLPQQRRPSDKARLRSNDVVWDREGDELVFWGGFLTLPGLAGSLDMEAYVFGLDENDRPEVATRNRHLVTPGLRLRVKPAPGRLDGELEAALQIGSIRASTAADAVRQRVRAHMAHGEIGYSLAVGWAPRFSLLADIGSGDHAGSSSYNRFDYLYGPQRTDWGPTGLYGAFSRNNIVSVGAKIEVKPGKRMDAFVTWREAWLDSATDSFGKTSLRDPAGATGRYAGRQVEARARYWLVPGQMQLDIGGAWLGKGRFLRQAPNAPAQGDTLATYLDLNLLF